MKEAAEQLRGFLPANAQAAEVLEPGNGALHGPTPLVTTKPAAILCHVFRFAIAAMQRDQLNAFLGQRRVERIAVVGFVTDESRGHSLAQHEVEHSLDQLALVWNCRECIDRHRQAPASTIIIIFHDFFGLGGSDAVTAAPGLAEGAVDVALIHVVALAPLDAPASRSQDVLEDTLADPFLEPAMHRALRAESSRQVLPLLPLSSIQKMPRRILRLSAAGRPPSGLRGESGIRSTNQSNCPSVSYSMIHIHTPETRKGFGIDSSVFHAK